MLERLARMLFTRLGRRYKLVFVATQIPASVRGTIALKGKSEPVELFAPAREERALSVESERRARRDPPVRPLR